MNLKSIWERFERIEYPRLTLIVVCSIVSYLLFQADFFKEVSEKLNHHGYYSIFLAGFLFAYGFTAPFAIGFFVELAPYDNIFLASIVGGCGTVLADLLIFQFVRTSFQSEIDKLKATVFFQKIYALFHHHISNDTIKKYVLWVFAGFLIASPLPDEFGVSLLSGFTTLDKKLFAGIAFLLDTTGIFVLLSLI